MAGYLAGSITTWEGAKRAYNLETEGLAIFACAAGVNNAVDPFEMGKMQHELQRCLPPLQLTQEMREFVTAPTPPPAVPIPFPPGLFSPLATPPQHTAFRFGGSVMGPIQGAAAAGGGAGGLPEPSTLATPLPLPTTSTTTLAPAQAVTDGKKQIALKR